RLRHRLQATRRGCLSLAGHGRGPDERGSSRRRVGHAPGRHRLVEGPARPALPPASHGEGLIGLGGLSGLSRRAAPAARLFSRAPGNRSGLQHVLIGMSPADPAAAGLPPTAAEQLPDDLATLKRMVLELLASLHERDRDIEGYRHRINLLLRRLY